MKEKDVDVRLVTIWSEGLKVETSAKYNTDSNTVYDLKLANYNTDGLGDLERQYIRLKDKTELEVYLDEENNYKVIIVQ